MRVLHSAVEQSANNSNCWLVFFVSVERRDLITFQIRQQTASASTLETGSGQPESPQHHN